MKLMKKGKESLTAYMAALILQLEKEGRPGTAHVYRSTLRRVLDFTGGVPLSFCEVTPLWLKSFQNYLLDRQLQWNSISTYMRMLRAVYFRGVDAGRAPFRPRLFKGVYTGTRVTVKRALDESVFRKLDTPLPGCTARLEKARLLFLLLFMLRGIPFVDVAYLRKCDLQGDVLVYRRRKTGSWLSVQVEPRAMSLIEQLKTSDEGSPYLFPFIKGTGIRAYRCYQAALRNFNADLKQLGVRMGIGSVLSSYCARHSWATIANYHNYQQELISHAMGHSSVKVTETYFKRHTDERIGQMNREILSQVFCA